MNDLPKIILLLETSIEYGRGLLRGVVRYERTHGPWSIHATPGHFKSELPDLGLSEQTGIIARIATVEEAKVIVDSGFPAIVLEPSIDEPALSASHLGIHEIRSNSPVIAKLCADHLLGLGLVHFAFCGYNNCPWSSARQSSFVECVEAHGLSCLVYPAEKSISWQYDRLELQNWLRGLPKQIGLMACNDMVGRQILEACANVGIRVPDEVSVIGVDNDELLCDLATPPLSSVMLDLDSAGYAAAELLEQLMSGDNLGTRQIVNVNPLKVIERRSTDPVIQQHPQVAEALRFIRDHAGKPITITDIADHVGVSRRTLERCFRKHLDCSIYDELTLCRLERAKRLLKETSIPVYRVAKLSGFSTLQPMMRLFLRREGRTPLEYRNLDQC